MGPLALIACLDGVGEMTTLDLGTQRCEQPLQPFFQRNWLLFPRLFFAWNTGPCAAGSLWRHPDLVWLGVVVEVHLLITELGYVIVPLPLWTLACDSQRLNEEIKTQMSTEESVLQTTTTMNILTGS